MRGVPGLVALAAVAAVPVEDGGRDRLEAEVDGQAAVVAGGDEPVGALLERQRPSVVPDVQRLGVRPRPAHAGPVQPLGHVVLPPRHVGDGEVRHVEIAHGPARRVDGPPVHARPEERHLVAEAAPARRLQVAGVVPPLDAVVGMGGVVARKNERVARIGAPPGAALGRNLDGGLRSGRTGSGHPQQCGGQRHPLQAGSPCDTPPRAVVPCPVR